MAYSADEFEARMAELLGSIDAKLTQLEQRRRGLPDGHTADLVNLAEWRDYRS